MDFPRWVFTYGRVRLCRQPHCLFTANSLRAFSENDLGSTACVWKTQTRCLLGLLISRQLSACFISKHWLFIMQRRSRGADWWGTWTSEMKQRNFNVYIKMWNCSDGCRWELVQGINSVFMMDGVLVTVQSWRMQYFFIVISCFFLIPWRDVGNVCVSTIVGNISLYIL